MAKWFLMDIVPFESGKWNVRIESKLTLDEIIELLKKTGDGDSFDPNFGN